jgi:hypothetical protein
MSTAIYEKMHTVLLIVDPYNESSPHFLRGSASSDHFLKARDSALFGRLPDMEGIGEYNVAGDVLCVII